MSRHKDSQTPPHCFAMQQALLNRAIAKYQHVDPPALLSSSRPGIHAEQVMRCCAALTMLALVALGSGAAIAGDGDKPSSDPNFGSRTDKPDGSSTMRSE